MGILNHASIIYFNCILFRSGVLVLKNAAQSDAVHLDKSSTKLRKLIIDTDAGADDALAILLALKYEKIHNESIKIIAITCTYGNTEKRNVEKNVLKTLTIANRSDIPVFGGAERPLIKNWENNNYFGTDGLGDFEFTNEITATVDRSKHAAVALIDIVKSNPGEVSIITLGPLTNLALAAKLYPTFLNFVDELYIVGSSVSGIGNIRPNVEFNFGTDPESSFIVLNSTNKPTILMPWEIVLESPITKEWRKNVFGKLNSPAVEFLNKAETLILGRMDTWSAIDARIVATFLWPNLITKFFVTNVTPVFDGAAQGSILVDYLNISGKFDNAKIIQLFDLKLYKTKLLEYFAQ